MVTWDFKTDLFDYIELVSEGDLGIKGGQNGLGLCYQHDISKVTRLFNPTRHFKTCRFHVVMSRI